MLAIAVNLWLYFKQRALTVVTDKNVVAAQPYFAAMPPGQNGCHTGFPGYVTVPAACRRPTGQYNGTGHRGTAGSQYQKWHQYHRKYHCHYRQFDFRCSCCRRCSQLLSSSRRYLRYCHFKQCCIVVEYRYQHQYATCSNYPMFRNQRHIQCGCQW